MLILFKVFRLCHCFTFSRKKGLYFKMKCICKPVKPIIFPIMKTVTTTFSFITLNWNSSLHLLAANKIQPIPIQPKRIEFSKYQFRGLGTLFIYYFVTNSQNSKHFSLNQGTKRGKLDSHRSHAHATNSQMAGHMSNFTESKSIKF